MHGLSVKAKAHKGLRSGLWSRLSGVVRVLFGHG